MNPFKVVNWRGKDNDVIDRFEVCDDPGLNERWPAAVTFIVSERYDEQLQRRRAMDYCDFLNAQFNAAEKAAAEFTITSTVAKRLAGGK